MRILMLFILLAFSVEVASANDFYQNNNPFPMQTSQPEYNNIYSTSPQVKAKEEQEKAKTGFLNKKKKTKKVVKDEIKTFNDGIQGTPDGSFYVFPAR